MSFFLAALVLSVVVPTYRWVPVQGGNGTHRDYLDQQSIQRKRNKVTLWTRRNFAGEQRTLWHEIEVDCATRSDTIMAWVQDDVGTVTHNLVRPHRPPAAIPPNSLGQAIFDLVCR